MSQTTKVQNLQRKIQWSKLETDTMSLAWTFPWINKHIVAVLNCYDICPYFREENWNLFLSRHILLVYLLGIIRPDLVVVPCVALGPDWSELARVCHKAASWSQSWILPSWDIFSLHFHVLSSLPPEVDISPNLRHFGWSLWWIHLGCTVLAWA